MGTEILVRTPPTNEVDITKLSVEGLVMLFIFMPNYLNELEGGMVSAAREELIRRGVLTIVDDRTLNWDLTEDVRENLLRYSWLTG